ncbi:DUF6265 family protein [Sphingomonas sp.]|uniref:DUF6265 family protein n=1 Tax=Sphingomonas sp. TaxID=28214 RepID=UPI001B1E6B8C|nr:DUF6265 family protein [Sphingomonas sp.]MBO9715217.1 hypothetical protein [Sphingomonas sp.]
MWRLAMIMLGLLAAAPAPAPALPDWMAGCWEQRDGERWTEECWMPPRGGVMLGAGRSGRGETVREWEATQIVAEGEGMAYFASPGGSGRTRFAWVPSAEPGVAFVNREHDYPQRIRYWREGKELLAEISLADGTRPMRWRYRRTGG